MWMNTKFILINKSCCIAATFSSGVAQNLQIVSSCCANALWSIWLAPRSFDSKSHVVWYGMKKDNKRCIQFSREWYGLSTVLWDWYNLWYILMSFTNIGFFWFPFLVVLMSDSFRDDPDLVIEFSRRLAWGKNNRKS
jgi:hypothetical protein